MALQQGRVWHEVDSPSTWPSRMLLSEHTVIVCMPNFCLAIIAQVCQMGLICDNSFGLSILCAEPHQTKDSREQ